MPQVHRGPGSRDVVRGFSLVHEEEGKGTTLKGRTTVLGAPAQPASLCSCSDFIGARLGAYPPCRCEVDFSQPKQSRWGRGLALPDCTGTQNDRKVSCPESIGVLAAET